ncbi:hypothetical protein LIER_18859 [Lithospermum erythrorhizon]|uniref:Pentatricopeptide repeat-containing protein n=1 Tax=Lithospermum erythrorhizon TaxID=34254 RepID=A0AAV3QIF6_LITER
MAITSTSQEDHSPNWAAKYEGIKDNTYQGTCLTIALCPFMVGSLNLVDLNLSSWNVLSKFRGYCSVVKDGVDSDYEFEVGDDEGKSKGAKSKVDAEEVDRVCKLIDELFALDRNMEAVLDGCGVVLTHDLVVDVLDRFKHARKVAFQFFCWSGDWPGFGHDSGTYNKMMEILGKTKQFETMVSVLEDMGERGLLTLETFQISIKAFAAAKERKKAVGLFELMKKYKFKVRVETINCLLDELGKAKLGKEAQTLFERLEHRFTPNIRSYTVLLNGWCRVKNLLEAGKIWNMMIDKGFKPDIAAHNTMLDGLLKCKKRSDAIKLFEVMRAKGPSPNVKSYTILIRDLCKQGEMDMAIGYFGEMLDSGGEPDAAIYTCLVTGYGNQNKMDKVYRLLVEMKEKGFSPDAQLEKGFSPDAQLYNALIKLMINHQMLEEIVQVYKKMIQGGLKPTIHTYNMMMRSYFIAKDYDMASAVWEEMKRKACKFLEEMLEKGMKAPQLDYNSFAADFSRAGKPDILDELAQRTKFSGKSEVSNEFARWAEMMKKRVTRRDSIRAEERFIYAPFVIILLFQKLITSTHIKC